MNDFVETQYGSIPTSEIPLIKLENKSSQFERLALFFGVILVIFSLIFYYYFIIKPKLALANQTSGFVNPEKRVVYVCKKAKKIYINHSGHLPIDFIIIITTDRNAIKVNPTMRPTLSGEQYEISLPAPLYVREMIIVVNRVSFYTQPGSKKIYLALYDENDKKTWENHLILKNQRENTIKFYDSFYTIANPHDKSYKLFTSLDEDYLVSQINPVTSDL